MKMWKLGGIGLALLLACSASGRAQGIPGVPPAAAPVAPAAAAAAAGGGSFWTKFCLTPEQKALCKEKLCKCKLIQLMNNSLAPVSALSGGVIPQFCPVVSFSDLKKPADSAEGAAARIKQDEAEAKARREAVRFLATVDCRYWPEAQDALIKALRADRNECVRWEAAMSLGQGCCCTKPVMRALTIAISCSNEDDNPIEKSPRVRAAARAALERCVCCFVETTKVPEPLKKEEETPGTKPEPGLKPEEKPAPGTGGVAPGTGAPAPGTGAPMTRSEMYYEKIKQVPRSRLVADAKRALDKATMPNIESDVPPPGSRSVFQLMSHMTHPDTTQMLSTNETAIVQEPHQTPAPPIAQQPVQRVAPQQLPPTVQAPTSKPLPVPQTNNVKPVGMSTPYSAPTPVTPAVNQVKQPFAAPAVVNQVQQPVQQPVPAAKPTTTPHVPTLVAPPARVAVEPQQMPSRVNRPVTQNAQPVQEKTAAPYTTRMVTPTIRRYTPAVQAQQPTPTPKQPKLVFQRPASEVNPDTYQYPSVETPEKSEQK